jgi:4-aminobutyrate aminotransferase-like enzyme
VKTRRTVRATCVKSRMVLGLLRDYESRNVTFVAADHSWPIVWERAKGVCVWDADGRKYLDLTAAFGVAAAGHANPRVVRAGQQQMARLLHAMGDVHPHALKAQLARELSRITFERWRGKPEGRNTKEIRNPKSEIRNQPCLGKTIFCNSGFEAVEAALKTAVLATGCPGVIAFSGAYHGLGYGALNATHRGHFKSPFRGQLGGFGHFAPFPTTNSLDRIRSVRSSNRRRQNTDVLDELESDIRRILRREDIGAVLVEPMQVRGGINIPPLDFLPRLRRICDEHQLILIFDEIYTGFGRTGRWFACEHSKTVPDLICLGKALTGGFPLSACVGRSDLMDKAWPPSNGEAIHTSTYLGHPVGCAMALAQVQELEERKLPERSAELGAYLLEALHSLISNNKYQIGVRGAGLLAGVELRLPNGRPATEAAWTAITTLLLRGFIVLPEGEHGNVLSLTPPLTISRAQLQSTVDTLHQVLS